MFPKRLLDADVKSPAEEKLFPLLETGLDDEWECFHSAGLIARDPAEGAIDDELDFVLCHPEKGIVGLEVKGGGIECRHGEWRRIAGGKKEWMPDPFAQALDHRYNLERKIAEVPGWKQKVKDLFFVHGVAFPDITAGGLVLAPDAPPQIVIDRKGVRDLAASIDRVLAYHRGARDKRKPPGKEGAAILRELLAPQFTIEVPLAEKIIEEEEQLVRLTVDQTRLLNAYGRNRRMLVTGCAGSGKTLLAVERAKRLAADGQDVLFVCFNRRLRDHLAERERGSGIDFFTFHRLLSSHGTSSGNSRVAAAGRLGNYTLTEERGKLGNYVHFSWIRAFKGLESPVVILCELEDLDDESIDQQLYVGVSRAKNHGVVVVPG